MQLELRQAHGQSQQEQPPQGQGARAWRGQGPASSSRGSSISRGWRDTARTTRERACDRWLRRTAWQCRQAGEDDACPACMPLSGARHPAVKLLMCPHPHPTPTPRPTHPHPHPLQSRPCPGQQGLLAPLRRRPARHNSHRKPHPVRPHQEDAGAVLPGGVAAIGVSRRWHCRGFGLPGSQIVWAEYCMRGPGLDPALSCALPAASP
jgi:hypothetical protein